MLAEDPPLRDIAAPIRSGREVIRDEKADCL
jgi:hypothetical protein